MTVLILMATYNGEAYLAEQLASLQAQTHQDWRLLARDDGSTDGTRDILLAHAEQDSRIELLEVGAGRAGPAGNFRCLLEAAAEREESLIAFCDQDDVWVADKLATQCAALRRLDDGSARGDAMLVHGDLEVTDEAMQLLHGSMARLQRFDTPSAPGPLTLLVQNHAVGCTMLFNRPLLELALPVPEDVHMHDWWLALLAEFAGRRVYLDQPLVRYRQHSGNAVGALGLRGRLMRPLGLVAWLRKMNHIHSVTWAQAGSLLERLERCSESADPVVQQRTVLLRAYCDLAARSAFPRVLGLKRLGVRAQNWPMTVLYYLQALRARL